MKIAIVDYGLANLRSVFNAFKCFADDVEIAEDAGPLADADRIVLPGVGSFDRAMEELERRGHAEALEKRVRREGVPFLGICLGQQLICASSEEGERPGLGWLAGRVQRIPATSPEFKVPHVGWNDVTFREGSGLHGALGESADFYFVHSYRVPLEGPIAEVAVGVSDYDGSFASVVEFDNVAAVQFHPEKSQLAGMKLLERFVKG